ncbi:ARC6/PARC6 family protein [Cyanobium sp. WAJ14-Wanaka]|nr:ARC6/PARC6 family protein [Cyanobium sp. WAJ14-Wanaka]
MELPIDHFRLLGVGPTTDAQSVLHTLQQRLDRPPSQGFTPETLQAREELLRATADLLSDSDRRLAYETDLTAISTAAGAAIAALDVSSSLEVGGLLLLLEAGQPLECFELASRSLQPPQAPALGSGREADLALLAGLAGLAGAADLHAQRRYEGAAQILKQGLQVLQRMGQWPALRQQLSDELEGLTPYRVLDLLSRNLTASGERAEGMALLEDLVKRRGGLDGIADPLLDSEQFEAFFKQIRAFLTVQEQVDLFSRWADEGEMPRSAKADSLATKALTASGFVQRKPDRIAAAKQRLQACKEAQPETLLACLHLLLGEVEQARALFEKGASPAQKQWVASQSSDPLAQLCAHCSDWLKRDVLPGYRDLEADADLEAYFADRDVQAYVERHDPKIPAPFEQTAPSLALGGPNPFAVGPAQANQYDQDDQDDQDDLEDEPWLDSLLPNWQWPDNWRWPENLQWPQNWGLPQNLIPSRPSKNQWGAAAAALVVAVGAAAVVSKLANQPQTSATNKPALAIKPAAPKPAPPKPPELVPAAVPLVAAEPNDDQVRALLEAWLAAKAEVLAGKNSKESLEAMARPAPIEHLQAQRATDQASGTTQQISTRITNFEIDQRRANRIAADVSLEYRETVLDAAGKPQGPTSTMTLRNRYVFGLDGGSWRLVYYEKVPNQ